MSNLLVTLIEMLAYLAALVVARWLMLMSTPARDYAWCESHVPDISWLTYYRWPEYAHQLRGQHIIDMVRL